MLSRLDCDNYDNGVYQVGEGWTIVGRWGKGSESLQATLEPLGTAERIKYQTIMDHLAETLKAAQPVDA
jgi:microcystin degradation protein MlrC